MSARTALLTLAALLLLHSLAEYSAVAAVQRHHSAIVWTGRRMFLSPLLFYVLYMTFFDIVIEFDIPIRANDEYEV